MANKEAIRKWVEALRSGKYKQTKKMLRGNVGYCCLGVACDISGIGKWDKNGRYVCGPKDARGDTLPTAVMSWLDVEDPTVRVLYNRSYDSATLLNDRGGLSFAQIADVLEDNFLKGAANDG